MIRLTLQAKHHDALYSHVLDRLSGIGSRPHPSDVDSPEVAHDLRRLLHDLGEGPGETVELSITRTDRTRQLFAEISEEATHQERENLHVDRACLVSEACDLILTALIKNDKGNRGDVDEPEAELSPS